MPLVPNRTTLVGSLLGGEWKTIGHRDAADLSSNMTNKQKDHQMQDTSLKTQNPEWTWSRASSPSKSEQW